MKKKKHPTQKTVLVCCFPKEEKKDPLALKLPKAPTQEFSLVRFDLGQKVILLMVQF